MFMGHGLARSKHKAFIIYILYILKNIKIYLYICLMKTFHIHINWSQLLLQKIVLCLPPPWETIISDEIEKPVSDNLRLSLIVVSKYSVSGFFLSSISASFQYLFI